MLFTDYRDYETLALVGLAVAFEIAERTRPARTVDRRAHFRYDLLALLVLTAAVAASRNGLLAAFSAALPDLTASWLERLRSLPRVPKVALAMLVIDLVLYWIHRAMHKFDALWRTHEWHHSVEHLYWFAGFRTSLLHAFLFTIPQILIPFVLLRATPLEAGVGFSIGIFTQLWDHSNIRVNLGPLAWLIITPEYHRVHHSATRHRDMNLGITLTIWDRLFGTYVDPKSLPENYKMGLGYKKSLPRMLVGV